MRDVILSVRADEAIHRSTNHHFSDIPQFYDILQQEIKISEIPKKDMCTDKFIEPIIQEQKSEKMIEKELNTQDRI